MGRTKSVAKKATTIKKFAYKKTKAKYDDIISKRIMCFKKRFIFTHEENTMVLIYVHEIIGRDKWNEFVKQPESTVVLVVQEFYSNFPNDDQEWVLVQGVKVSFDQANFNSIFKLDTHEDGYDEYIQ